MKVLKPGKLPHIATNWYYRVVNVCWHCGAEYICEVGDSWTVGGRGTWVASRCPTCGHTVQTERPLEAKPS